MDPSGNDDQYFVFENRLASFQGPQPVARRRPSTTAGPRAPKVLSWPHKTPAPIELARAGFYFNPSPSNPDNVSCFLCRKDMDGWEDDDDPLQEHLKHSGSCGWAVCTAIELELGDASTDDPRLPYLLEARKATFAGRWPYENKKGWKCKTKQLAEAGWKYTPTLESDDHTTCTYCQLALDGWEAGDKPLDEHKRRSPNCPFFVLTSQHSAPKKTARGKAARSSKISRLSFQSVATVASDAQSQADPDDSIMTATTTMTQGTTTTRKTTSGRPRKATSTAAKGRKTRAKKDGPIEVPEAINLESSPVRSPIRAEREEPVASPPKPTRGKKRGSDAMEPAETADVAAPAPPRKKRTTRVRASQTAAVEAATDYAMFNPVPPEVDEAAIEEELRTLAREMAVDDVDSVNNVAVQQVQQPQQELHVPKKGGRQTGTTRKVSKQARKGKQSAAAAPPPSVVEPVLDTMQTDEPEHEERREHEDPTPEAEPHKQAKRPKAKTSIAKAKAKKMVPEPPRQDGMEEPDELHEISIISVSSTKTAVHEVPAPKRGRGRPSKKSVEMMRSRGNEIAGTTTTAAVGVATTTATQPAKLKKKGKTLSAAPPPDDVASPPAEPAPALEKKQKDKALPPLPQQQQQREQQHHPSPAEYHLPATPNVPRSTPSQRTLMSPSQSPQSSDAENQPPSSKASGAKSTAAPAAPTIPMGAAGKRVALAPMQAVATPVRAVALSPSKRQNNVIGGLRSAVPWSAVDVDRIFAWGSKENADAGSETAGSDLVAHLVRPGAELSTPEKAMTVEAFIYHNAGMAERLLKDECEAMVTAFERQGSRAMQVLESLEVEE